jgi:hypothetical protein
MLMKLVELYLRFVNSDQTQVSATGIKHECDMNIPAQGRDSP